MHFKEQYLEKDLVGLLTLRWDLKTIMALMITYMSLHSTKQGTIFRIVSKATNATTTD
jgi:hypothetical protein